MKKVNIGRLKHIGDFDGLGKSANYLIHRRSAMLVDESFKLSNGSSNRKPKEQKPKPRDLIVNNNLFNTCNIEPQLRDLLEFLIQKNSNLGIETRKFWSKQQMLENMKGNVQLMTRQQALLVMWNEFFPQQNCTEDIDIFLSYLAEDAASYNYSFTNDPHKPLDNLIDQEIQRLEFEGRQLQEDLLEAINVTRNRIQHQKRLVKDVSYFLKMIIKREGQVFVDSIMALDQIEEGDFDAEGLDIWSETLVRVYFEQAYPMKIMAKRQLIQMMGQERYSRKIAAMPLMDHQRQERLRESSVISCHFCRNILYDDDTIYPCGIRLSMESLNPTMLTNPQLYHQCLYGYDYFDPEYQGRAIKPSYSHPYLTYHHYVKKQGSNGKLRPICRRVYCESCYISQVLNQDPKGFKLDRQEKDFFCRYCQGSCKCKRCLGMDFVIRGTAYYMKLGGSLKKIIDNFVFPKCAKIKLHGQQLSGGSGQKRLQKKILKQLKQQAHALEKMYRLGFIKEIANTTYTPIKYYDEEEVKAKRKRHKEGKLFQVGNHTPLIPLSKINLGLGTLRNGGQILNPRARHCGSQSDSESWDVQVSSESSGQAPKPIQKRENTFKRKKPVDQVTLAKKQRLQEIKGDQIRREENKRKRKLKKKVQGNSVGRKKQTKQGGRSRKKVETTPKYPKPIIQEQDQEQGEDSPMPEIYQSP